MTVNAALRIEGSVIGMAGGAEGISLSVFIASAIGQRQLITLASGANTITVPTGSTMVIIVPPTTNTQTMTLKGVTGDTGIALDVAKPFVLSLAAGVASFVITAGAQIVGVGFTFL